MPGPDDLRRMTRNERIEPTAHVRLYQLEQLAAAGHLLDQETAWMLVDVAMRLTAHVAADSQAYSEREIAQMHRRLQAVERAFHVSPLLRSVRETSASHHTGGPYADAYLARFAQAVAQPPTQAALDIPVLIFPYGRSLDGLVLVACDSLASTGLFRPLPQQTRPYPGQAYTPDQHRYCGNALLDDLSGIAARTGDRRARALGILDDDLVVPARGEARWGILGLGEIPGQGCAVSAYRLGLDGAPAPTQEKRFRKGVLHEMLHTLGLPHCPVPEPRAGSICLMHDACGRLAMIDRYGDLCPVCSRALDGHLARTGGAIQPPGHLAHTGGAVEPPIDDFVNDWLGTLGVVAIDPPHNGRITVLARDPLMLRAVMPKNYRGYEIVIKKSGAIVVHE